MSEPLSSNFCRMQFGQRDDYLLTARVSEVPKPLRKLALPLAGHLRISYVERIDTHLKERLNRFYLRTDDGLMVHIV